MRPETRHSIVVVSGTGVTALLSLVYAAYAGRRLGRESYADFTAAVALATLCYIALGPINGAVAKFTAQFASHQEYGKVRGLCRGFVGRVALYGLAGAGVALLALKPLAGHLRFHSALALLISYGVVYLNLLLSVARGALRGLQSFGQYNANVILEAALRLITGVLLLRLGDSVAFGLLAYILALLAVLVFSQVQLGRTWRGYDPQPVDFSAVRQFTLPMFLMMMATAGFLYLDVLFVKRYFTAAEAGLYGAAVTLAGALGVLATPFNIVLLPLLTAAHEQGRRTAGPFLRICAYFFALTAGPLAAVVFWPEPIMRLIYGPEFAPAAPWLAGLALSRILIHLTHLVMLVPVTRGSFRFLWIYLSGMALEVLLLLYWHATVGWVIAGLVIAQGLTLACMLVFVGMVRPAHTARPSPLTAHS